MGERETELERLLDRLFGTEGVETRNFQITRGDRPATAEEIAGEINRAMDQAAAGDIRDWYRGTETDHA